jgi:hypothetical protein
LKPKLRLKDLPEKKPIDKPNKQLNKLCKGLNNLLKKERTDLKLKLKLKDSPMRKLSEELRSPLNLLLKELKKKRL